MESAEPETIRPFFEFFKGIDAGNVFAVIFSLIFLWWLIYTLVAIYHWLRYGYDSWISVPAIAIYLFVSGWLIFFATSGLH